MRRLFWALTGIGLGAVVGIRAARAVSRAGKRYSPAGIASAGGGLAERLGERLREALDAGRDEMRVREAELRAELNLPPGDLR